MNVPFIKYVESLVITKKPFDEIFNTVKKLDVEMSSLFEAEDISIVINTLRKSNPTYFSNPTAVPDLAWLKSLGVDKMVAYLLKLEIPGGVIGIRGAFEILDDKPMYQTMTSMALASVTEEDIELIINAKYNIHYESDDIKEFLHYFFNVESWTLTDKRNYVNFVGNSTLKKYYNLAISGDKDYLIWSLGISPEKSFEAMLREMGTDCYYNFRDKMKRNPEEAQKWGMLALRIVDKLDRLDEVKEEKQSLTEQIEFTLRESLLTNTELKKELTGNPLITNSINTKEVTTHIDDMITKGEIAIEK